MKWCTEIDQQHFLSLQMPLNAPYATPFKLSENELPSSVWPPPNFIFCLSKLENALIQTTSMLNIEYGQKIIFKRVLFKNSQNSKKTKQAIVIFSSSVCWVVAIHNFTDSCIDAVVTMLVTSSEDITLWHSANNTLTSWKIGLGTNPLSFTQKESRLHF